MFSPAPRNIALFVLLLAACAPFPENELTPLDPPAAVPEYPGYLVDIRDVDPTILIDLRYASSNNITGDRLYPRRMPCLVNRSTAGKLRLAHEHLKAQGDYRLVIWDAYRPPSVQRKLFAAAPEGGWVAEPETSWSHHNFGTAVDVTLADARGHQLPMPTDFDDLSERADFRYLGDDEEIRQNLEVLQEAMSRAGFLAAPGEWWHFYDITANGARLVHAHELGIEVPE